MDTARQKLEIRNRPPVSCEPCRARKLKCNRSHPCDACLRRGNSSSCVYAPNASRIRGGAPSRKPELKDRLEILENLVSSILAGNTVLQAQSEPEGANKASPNEDSLSSIRSDSPASRTDSSLNHQQQTGVIPTPESLHLQEIEDGQVNYVDPSHWQSILNDVQEVREHLSRSGVQRPKHVSDTSNSQVMSVDSFALDSDQQSSNLEEILTSFPPRPTCDKLISWYFNSTFMVLGWSRFALGADDMTKIVQGILHPVKFQAEYSSFWKSPSNTSPIWVALLFSLLSVSAIVRGIQNGNDSDNLLACVPRFQTRTSQCLVLGKYATANSHALEAFILHFQNRFISPGVQPSNLWFEMGTALRLAIRLGYHRDPKHLAGISPFDGEMRRRVWVNIFQVDALMSFQMGFPSMIPVDFCDVETPRNLQYSDFEPSTKFLPPSRPFSERTPVLYIIVKSGVMGVFRKITSYTQSSSAPTYNNTLLLDTEMKAAYLDIPQSLKARDISNSLLDDPSLIWQRCTLELLYLKGLIVLHRRSITSSTIIAPDAPFSSPSLPRQTCLDAALAILHRQSDLYEACQPTGRLYEDRWVIGTLPPHDFLLAAMIICLDLSIRLRKPPSTSPSSSSTPRIADPPDFNFTREFTALQTSHRIWASMDHAALPDARTAAQALSFMVQKVTETYQYQYSHSVGIMTPLSAEQSVFEAQNMEFGSGFDKSSDLDLPFADAMLGMIDGNEVIDWNAWDQYL